MRSQREKRFLLLLSWMLLPAVLLTGCGSSGSSSEPEADVPPDAASAGPAADAGQGDAPEADRSELTVRFGDEGEPFTLHMEDNETADDIVRHVGTASWRLPIYHYDDYEGWGNKIVNISA